MKGEDFKTIGNRVMSQLAQRQKWVTIDEKHVTIKIPPPVRATYPIELSRIPTPESLLGWLQHMAEKTWWNKDLQRVFVAKVADAKGWELHF